MACSMRWRGKWEGLEGRSGAWGARSETRALHTPHSPLPTRMKILLVNWQDRDNPQAGGAEIHLHEIFGRLSNRGHHVTLLCGGWPGCDPTARLDGIHVVRVGTRYTFPFV